MPKCLECRFWQREWDGHYSYYDSSRNACLRRAPVAMLRITTDSYPQQPSGMWPHTNGGDWCGEFEAYVKQAD